MSKKYFEVEVTIQAISSSIINTTESFRKK
jgi:hypothetical protein